jgi:tetratricopeptide (TPR) repeat protein
LALKQPAAAEKLACGYAARAGGLEQRLQDFAVTLCARAEADGGDADGALARLLMAAKDRPQSERLIDALRSVANKASPSRQAALRQHLEAVAAAGDASDDVVVAAAFAFDAVGAGPAGRQLLVQALAKKPRDPTLVFGHARLLVDQAESDSEVSGGVELVERLVERAGADVAALNFMAFSLAERALDGRGPHEALRGRSTDARGWAWQAVLLDPLNGYVVDTLGWTLVMDGDYDGAVDVLRRADRLSPGEGEIWFHLATALSKQHDVDAARAAVARARSLLPAGDALLPRVDQLERELS